MASVIAARPLVAEWTTTIVSRSHGSPVCLSRMPPQRSTTLLPLWYAQHAPPSSRRRMKLSTNASRTASKPWLTCPSTVTRSNVATDMTPSYRSNSKLRSFTLRFEHTAARTRLRACRDTKQLLSLHDEVNGTDGQPCQRQRQPMEPVPRSASDPHEKTCDAGRDLVEDERPRDLCRAIRRQPPKHQHPLGFHGQQRESVRHARQRREYRQNGGVLQFRHDVRGARPSAVVHPVIAVPARSVPGTHLYQPGPHVARRASNGHAVCQCVNRLRDPLVSGQRTLLLFVSCPYRREQCDVRPRGQHGTVQ